jgi:hypothetical protein
MNEPCSNCGWDQNDTDEAHLYGEVWLEDGAWLCNLCAELEATPADRIAIRLEHRRLTDREHWENRYRNDLADHAREFHARLAGHAQKIHTLQEAFARHLGNEELVALRQEGVRAKAWISALVATVRVFLHHLDTAGSDDKIKWARETLESLCESPPWSRGLSDG